MSIYATTLRRYAKPASLPANQSLFTAAVVAASLLLLGTGLNGQSITFAQPQFTGPAANLIPQEQLQAVQDNSSAQSTWSSVEPDAEPALVAAIAAVEPNTGSSFDVPSASVETPRAEEGAVVQEAFALERDGTSGWEAAAVERTAPAQEVAAAAPEAAFVEAPIAEQQAPALEQARQGSSEGTPREAPAAVVAPVQPAPQPAAAIALRPLEASMLSAINARRVAAGLRPVAIDPELTEVSRQRSNDMASRNYFSHTTPEGTGFVDALYAFGINTGTVGEILGRNNAGDDASVGMVVEAFTQSPSHNLHLVYSSYEWAGVGVAVGANSMKYYTIIFRAPA